MEVELIHRPGGIIEVSTSVEFGLFSAALADTISGRTPRDARQLGLSTCSIDRAGYAVRCAEVSRDTDPTAEGNAAYLRLDGQMVVANWDFEPDEDNAQSVPLSDFLNVLAV